MPWIAKRDGGARDGSPAPPKPPGALRYILTKWLIYVLLTIPAFAVVFLVAATIGQAGGLPPEETGFLRYGLFFASISGYAIFHLICYALWSRLKLGEMRAPTFVLRETLAYAGVLAPSYLVCAISRGDFVHSGGASLFLLPHLPLAFFARGWALLPCALAQLALFAALVAIAYRRNRKREREREESAEK